MDASSWLLVIPFLQAQGYNVLAVQNPLSSLADDVHVTRQALASLSGPTIVAGHSYGGAVMTNAGTSAPNLHSLVYIAAVAPLEGLAASLDAYWAAFTAALKLPNLSDLIQCLPYL